jgi:hypothetical protein
MQESSIYGPLARASRAVFRMSSEVKQMGVARIPTSVRRFGGGMSKSVHSAEVFAVSDHLSAELKKERFSCFPLILD